MKVNVFTVAGRLTADGELKYTANQKPVLRFSVATDVGWGENKHALFVRCSLWGQRAESLAPYIKKGGQVTVSGEADLRTWESNGKSGTSLELNVDKVELQGGKTEQKQEKQTGFRQPADEPFADDDIPF